MMKFDEYDLFVIADNGCCNYQMAEIDKLIEDKDEDLVFKLACEIFWREYLLSQLEQELIERVGYEPDREYYTVKECYGDDDSIVVLKDTYYPKRHWD